MNYKFLTKVALFRGTTEDELEEMLHCLGAYEKEYRKGEIILHAGDVTEQMGLVMRGSVNIENDDVWGNKTILSHVEVGQIFAETYACIPGEAMLVSVIAAENTTVMFLNSHRVLQTCSNSCTNHNKLIKNLLMISSQKNLRLSRRIFYTSSKSVRGRLMAYFSEMAIQEGSSRFTIPFNRQQLADYLSVDRSAMSNELSKMKKEGIISYEKNTFLIQS